MSQRNCTFALPEHLGITGEYRPTIQQGDARNINGLADDSVDHVLSHPPYKDCVQYSAHVHGDLSRINNPIEFQAEMTQVALESWR